MPEQEPFPGLFTIDTSAYYPEDRGISESIDYGRNLAKNIIKKGWNLLRINLQIRNYYCLY